MLKTLDERVSEIHRRSEIILQKRRKRKKYILLCSVPMVLCIMGILANAVFIRRFSPTIENGDSGVSQEITVTDAITQPTTENTQSVCIVTPKEKISISQSEKVAEIQTAFFQIMNRDIPDDSYCLGSSWNINFTYDSNTDFLIVFTNEKGELTQYVLRERLLFQMETREYHTLTDDDIAVLSEMFQISLEKE